jgi:hypothetical protein
MKLVRFALNWGGGAYYISDWIFLTSSPRKIGNRFSAYAAPPGLWMTGNSTHISRLRRWQQNM